MGRPITYSSSNERLRQGKKPKGNDPFGLNELLGIQDEEESCGDTALHNHTFEKTNFQEVITEDNYGGRTDEMLNPNGGSPPVGTVDRPIPQTKSGLVDGIEAEMEETMHLGHILGAQLNGFQPLVRETIEDMGLQTGDK